MVYYSEVTWQIAKGQHRCHYVKDVEARARVHKYPDERRAIFYPLPTGHL